MTLLIINLFLAVIPAFLLVRYFYRQDRQKPEPRTLIWKLFILGFFAVLPALFLEILILKRYFKRKLGLRKSHVYYAAALKSFPDNPGKCVRMCYYMTRTLLNMGGFPRPRNVELFDYGRSLSLVDTVFYKDVVVIFFMFSKLEYSAAQITEEEAEDTLERVEKVRNFIYPLIHEEAELSDGDDLNKYGI